MMMSPADRLASFDGVANVLLYALYGPAHCPSQLLLVPSTGCQSHQSSPTPTPRLSTKMSTALLIPPPPDKPCRSTIKDEQTSALDKDRSAQRLPIDKGVICLQPGEWDDPNKIVEPCSCSSRATQKVVSSSNFQSTTKAAAID